MPESVLACSWPTGRLFFLYTGKKELQAAFTQKLSAAQNNSKVRAQHDWSGIEEILKTVFEAFSDEA